jgi:hypothetical protein
VRYPVRIKGKGGCGHRVESAIKKQSRAIVVNRGAGVSPQLRSPDARAAPTPLPRKNPSCLRMVRRLQRGLAPLTHVDFGGRSNSHDPASGTDV